VANINFFSKVTVGERGEMQFQPGNSTAGDSVELRFEMNTLVVLSTSPHPLDPNPVYAPKALATYRVAFRSAGRGRLLPQFPPENRRGFYNTEILFR